MNIEKLKNEISEYDIQIKDIERQLDQHRKANEYLEVKEPAPYRTRKLYEKILVLKKRNQKIIDKYYIDEYNKKRVSIENLYSKIIKKKHIISILRTIIDDIEIKNILNEDPLSKIKSEYVKINYKHIKGFYDPIQYSYNPYGGEEDIVYEINKNNTEYITFSISIKLKKSIKNIENKINDIEQDMKNDIKRLKNLFDILKNDDVYNGVYKPYKMNIQSLALSIKRY